MTGFMWFKVVQAVVMAAIAVLIWTEQKSFRAGQIVNGLDYGPEIKALTERLDRVGTRLSDLGSKVQMLPEELRRDFVSREVYDREVASLDRDVGRLQAETDKLWVEVRRSSRPS